jgi:hypothetical protein
MPACPLDADMFWEMNNGRIADLLRPRPNCLGQRIGLIRTLRDRGWGLVVAGSSVRYRARIRPFQRFELRTWDARFIYIEQGMWRGDVACNHALMRTGVTEKGRLVADADAMGLSPDSPPARLGGWTDADLRPGRLLKPAISSRMQR